MSDSKDDKKPEDDQAFISTVQGLLRTPPKPHKDEQPKRPAKDKDDK